VGEEYRSWSSSLWSFLHSPVNSVTIALHISGLLVAHHQALTMCICNIIFWFRPVFPNFSTSRHPWPLSSYLTVPLTSLFISHGTLDLSLHISRYPWPLSSYLTVPLEENTYFLKLIYFLIISYVRDKVVYCCWVSVYALISDVILFIYLFLSLHLAVPLGSVRGTPGYRGNPVGNYWFRRQ
jgi:hypothetical protein